MQVIKQNPIRSTVGAIALLAITGVGIGSISQLGVDEAMMRMEPNGGAISLGEQFTKHIVIESSVPTNVFQGEIYFDDTYLAVEEIHYNTSIADIWAESPWYSRGDGSIHFIGGTSAPGGFVGSGVLLSVTYRSIAAGRPTIGFKMPGSCTTMA